MKAFLMLAVVAGFVSSSANAASVYQCSEEVSQWCNYSGSGVFSPEGFQRSLNSNANFCEVSDYAGNRGQGGFATKLRTFKMKNGSLTTILIHTTYGDNGKCVPETWNFTVNGARVYVDFIVQTGNKLWATSREGNLFFSRLGPPNTSRAGRPEWYVVKSRDGSAPLTQVSRISELPTRDGITARFSRSSEVFKADDTGRLISSGRAQRIDAVQYTY